MSIDKSKLLNYIQGQGYEELSQRLQRIIESGLLDNDHIHKCKGCETRCSHDLTFCTNYCKDSYENEIEEHN